jgi:putative transcriptional regulator
MSERDIGQEILDGIQEIKAYQAGQVNLRTRTLTAPAASQAIRGQLNLSQAAFAGLMGVSVRTVQDWEQGRREPGGPASSRSLW